MCISGKLEMCSAALPTTKYENYTATNLQQAHFDFYQTSQKAAQGITLPWVRKMSHCKVNSTSVMLENRNLH